MPIKTKFQRYLLKLENQIDSYNAKRFKQYPQEDNYKQIEDLRLTRRTKKVPNDTHRHCNLIYNKYFILIYIYFKDNARKQNLNTADKVVLLQNESWHFFFSDNKT